MKKKILAIIAVILALLLAVLAWLVVRSQQNEPIENAGSSEHAQRPKETLEYNGESCRIKRDISTLLVIGTDNYDNSDSGEFYNFEQADFLVILVFDHEAKTVSAVQLNRDTMCNVPWLDVLGKVGGTAYEQIALAHTYGSGREDSCENVVNTVQSLCFGAPIDAYAAFTMPAVPIVNDMIGGVDVTVPIDMTATDPSFTEGAELHLMGDQALKFARARMELGDENNEARLSRQRLYLEGFIVAARKAVAADSTLGLKIVDACGDMLCTDLTTTQMSTLINELEKYTYKGMDTPTGEDRLGKRFNEFYVDEESLWSAIRKAYCQED